MVAVIGLVATALSGCQLYLVAHTSPGTPDDQHAILAPTDHTQLAADFSSVDVTIQLPEVLITPSPVPCCRPRTVWSVAFETGSQSVHADITGLFTVEGRTARATLPRPIFVEGVTHIVSIFNMLGADPDIRRIAISWEPGIDVSTSSRCETLGQARCLLPFPSDQYTVEDPNTDTGLRVHLDAASLPANVRGDHIDPTEWNRNDGFSPGALIMAEVPGLDLARTDEPRIDALGRSLLPDSPIMVIDADTRERIPVFAEIDQASVGRTPLLLIHPVRNLEEGHHYVVGLRNLRRADGTLIEPSRSFRVYRDNIPTFIPEIEARRPAMFQNTSTLGEAGMLAQDMYLAWDFTVASERSLSERSLSIRDQTFEPLGTDGTLPFTIGTVTENPDANTRRRITGTFTVPN